MPERRAIDDPVCIVGLGACTAVGRGAWACAAAVRAGVAGFAQHPHMIDTAGEPMRVALAPWIDIGVRGVDRFDALLLPAIDEALAALVCPPSERGRWALALGLPSARPGLPPGLAGELLARVGRHHGHLLGRAATFENGHAAGLLALRAAVAKLRHDAIDVCLVAAVDSWIEPETLEWLEACDQLHGAGPLNNAWGFVPGEAGAALLVTRESIARHVGLDPLGAVLAVGAAHEPLRIKTETVCLGDGLTAAFREALGTLPGGERVTDIWCDLNGEPYRADEFGFTALRTKEHFESISDFDAPADCWGDVGAAGSLLGLALACAAGRKGYARGTRAFVWASAEGGERAAALALLPTAHRVDG